MILSAFLPFLCVGLGLVPISSQGVPARIQSLVEADNWAEAQSLLREFLAQDSDGVRYATVVRLATNWDRVQQWDRSLWTFREIAAIYPQFPPAGLNLANAFRRAGRYDDTEKVFHEWIGRLPSEPALRNDLGLLYQAQRRWDLAETEFREAIRLGSEDAPANLAILWRLQGRIEPGRQALEELLRKQPQSPWARRSYGLWRLDRAR